MDAANPVLATIAVLNMSSRIVDEFGEAGMFSYGGELPKRQVSLMPARGVVVALAGTPASIGTRDHLPVSKRRVDVRCYGRTRMEADDLAILVGIVLKAWKRTLAGRALVYSFEQSSGPVPTRDPDGDWPVSVVSFEVLLADELDAA